MNDRAEAVNELKATFRILNDDLSHVQKLAGVDPAFVHRTRVRTFIAFVEGLTNQLMRVAAASPPGFFTDAEFAALREESYEVDKSGVVKIKRTRLPLRSKVRLSLSYYPRVHGASFAADVGGVGWSAFIDALEIRNRLTHPRAEVDLQVSESDLVMIRNATGWYLDTVRQMFHACDEADDRLRGSSG